MPQARHCGLLGRFKAILCTLAIFLSFHASSIQLNLRSNPICRYSRQSSTSWKRSDHSTHVRKVETQATSLLPHVHVNVCIASLSTHASLFWHTTSGNRPQVTPMPLDKAVQYRAPWCLTPPWVPMSSWAGIALCAYMCPHGELDEVTCVHSLLALRPTSAQLVAVKESTHTTACWNLSMPALDAASAAWLEEAWTSHEDAEDVLHALRMCAERDQTSLSTYMLSLMPLSLIHI
eukprot:6217570-Amphidinium_carterae.3